MGLLERVIAIVVGIGICAAASMLVAQSDSATAPGTASVSVNLPTPSPTAPPPPPPAPTKAPAPKKFPPVGAVTVVKQANFRQQARSDSKLLGVLRPGSLLPVLGTRHGYFRVLTQFERYGWVHKTSAKGITKALKPATKLSDATLVIDPGHGGHLGGAKGPTGLKESVANLNIARHLKAKLGAARVFMTRGPEHAGLGYRSALANALNADAFISIHNNAAPDVLAKKPGTETYFQHRNPKSKRLAGLLWEEIFPALAKFKIAWGRDPNTGATFRRNRVGEDYYAVLRNTKVPAVIVEGMFITNAAEEALLRQSAVQDLEATAIANAVKRFFETKDAGSGYVDPYAKKHAKENNKKKK